MKGWKECKLGDFVRSVSETYQFAQDEEVIFLNTSDIYQGKVLVNDYVNSTILPGQAKKKISKNDILFSEIRPANGRYALIDFDAEKYVVSTKLMVLRCSELIDSRFVYHYITSNDVLDYLQHLAEDRSATFPQITFDHISDLTLLLPPLSEQRAIASVLSSLDDKIDLLHRQNKTLEAMAEALFRQWFVEPCKDGLPEGWREGKLGEEFSFTMGQSPEGSSFNEEGVGVPMFQGNADFGFRFPSERVYTTQPTRFAEPLDTLVSVRAPVGEQNMALVKCCIGRGVAAFRYKDNNDYYTYTFFKLRSLMTEIKQFNDEGTVFGSIGKSDFETMGISIPKEAIIDKYEYIARPLNDKVMTNCEQIIYLEKIRDSLLPKLMSGEVRVSL